MSSLSNENFSTGTSGVRVIQDPYLIQQLYTDLVRSAKEEVLLFLPTTSAFLREEKIGIIESLRNAATRGVRVRVLTPTDEKVEPKMQAAFDNKQGKLELRRVLRSSGPEGSHKGRTKILVIDNKEYLVVELKDDSKETFVDAVRLAIYSATESTVESYLTLFESLWEQAELYEKLEKHDKLQEEFIKIAAHELKTPVQPIVSLIELLKMTGQDASQEVKLSKEDFAILTRNADRLERLAKDILEVSRIESKMLTLSKETFDMNEKITNVIRDYESLAAANGNLEIRFRPGEPIPVLADRTRIFEVVSNLLRNAIKFTKQGTIEITLERKAGFVQVEIKDTGEGIDPKIIPRLFTKFATGSEQGTGLGLYICRNIVEAHGGRIWARNNDDGKGASFSFTLPLSF